MHHIASGFATLKLTRSGVPGDLSLRLGGANDRLIRAAAHMIAGFLHISLDSARSERFAAQVAFSDDFRTVRLWPEDGADLPLLSDAIDRAVESFGIMAEAAALAASLTYCQVCEQV